MANTKTKKYILSTCRDYGRSATRVGRHLLCKTFRGEPDFKPRVKDRGMLTSRENRGHSSYCFTAVFFYVLESHLMERIIF